MKSSDQRYFQVRRPKSQINRYVELAKALRDARHDPLKVIEVDKLVAASTTDFTHVMLVCGRTAKDFRRNFRRGCAEFNTVTAVQLVPYETLLKAELDGYSLLRLTKEQHWNVKQRWGKLREQDALLHDPQGAFWTRVLRALLDGRHDGHLSILTDIRDKGQRLVQARLGTSSEADKDRYVREFGRAQRKRRDEVMSPEECYDNARRVWVELNDYLSQAGTPQYLRISHNGRHSKISRAEWRLCVERCLLELEAVAVGDFRRVFFNPDTSSRHSRIRPRLENIRAKVLPLLTANDDRWLRKQAAPALAGRGTTPRLMWLDRLNRSRHQARRFYRYSNLPVPQCLEADWTLDAMNAYQSPSRLNSSPPKVG